jgi:tRNA (cmo5U34)-methyltransferase
MTWSDPAKVDEYVGRVGRLAARLAGEAALVELLPPAPRRLLDLGCGDGRLTALVLDARPGIVDAVAVDSSPPMLARARERFAAEPRVHVRERDLADPITGLGDFDVVVSGFAIHHLLDERKVALLHEIAAQLAPGGVYANLEVVASPTPELHAEFRRAIGREADDPEDRLVDVETQLGWMRAAGLAHVDCMWKWRGFALLAARRDRAQDRANRRALDQRALDQRALDQP